MKFPCPHCHQFLEALEEHQGLKADCGLCGGAFTVPAPRATPSKVAGIDAAELLARGLNTVHSPDFNSWEPPAPEELARLLPQYQIESIIGRGGMGAVYKGTQERLGRHVAIKLLPSELAEDANFVARFEREARTLAKLDHPGIIHVHDFGQTEEGHLYFVMEFVEGTDLHQLIHGPGVNPAQALEIIGQVCDALQFAHSKGVVHRDIKPANILVTTDGRVKLADFGLARPLKTGVSGQLTLTRVIMGTPDYMAPEQKRGEGDHRVDLYALGVMLYEMLCGRTPQGAWQPPSQRVQVDVRLDQVVIKAMQEEPERRYQQASQVKTDVEAIRNSPSKKLKPGLAKAPSAPAGPKAPGTAKSSSKSSSKKPLAIAAACLLPLLGIGGWWTSRDRHPSPRENDPAFSTASVELIALLDPSRDAGVSKFQNSWEKKGGELSYVGSGIAGDIGVPLEIRSNHYQIETDFSSVPDLRNSGHRFHIKFPNREGSSHLSVIFSTDGLVQISGLKDIRLKWSSAASSYGKIGARLDYRNPMSAKLEILRDGKVVDSWQGDAKPTFQAVQEQHPALGKRALARLVCMGSSKVTFRSFSLTLFEGETKVLRAPEGAVPAPPVPGPDPSAATKDQPFVNSLGMKFVPVPITGGPTDGKKILFSIWETRVRDYEQFAKETQRKWPKPNFEQDPDHPAVNVSWVDAKAFCEWLTLRERAAGKLGPQDQYRLPSDHEWSCAVGIGKMEDPWMSPKEKKGMIPDIYPWGTAWPPPENAGNYSTKFRDDGYPNTSPVGAFAANPLGLYDLSGNVAEWCEEWFNEATKHRVQRGHYFHTSMIMNHSKLSSARTSNVQDAVGIANGFRCVLASDTPPSTAGNLAVASPSPGPSTSAPPNDPVIARIEEALAEWRKLPEWNSHENGKRISRNTDGRYILDLSKLPVRDTSPLRALGGIPFQMVIFGGLGSDAAPPSIDLSPLAGLDLLSLRLGEIRVANLNALRGSKLRHITGSFESIEGAEGMMALNFPALYHSDIPDLEPVRGGKNIQRMNLVELPKLTDLSPLSTHPITHLNITNIPITSLEALKSCPLSHSLYLSDCNQLRDIAGIRGTEMATFTIHGCPLVTDLSPLLDCPKLVQITVNGYDPRLEPLRVMKLKTINEKPAADYWAEWDKARK